MSIPRPLLPALWLAACVACGAGGGGVEAAAMAAQPTAREARAETGELLRPGERGLAFELEDQRGGAVVYPLAAPDGVGRGQEPVVLVVWADRKGAKARGGWAEALRERYGARSAVGGGGGALPPGAEPPELVILPVAHLEAVPAPLRPLVRRRVFGDRERPVALDWKGEVAAQLGLEPGVPNLAVLDRDGRVVAKLAGEPTPERRAELFAVVDPLLGLADGG